MSPVPALDRALVALRRPDAVVLVDGRSGSGKTTFAAALAERGRSALLRLDDVYPGWDGLDAAALQLVAALRRRDRVEPAAVHGWDWSADRPGVIRHLPPSGPLVVEGCGALSRASSRSATLRVWVDLPDAERRHRALDRDGDGYAPHWDRWARQERAFLARERPRALADLVVDGSRFPHRAFSARSADPHYSRRP